MAVREEIHHLACLRRRGKAICRNGLGHGYWNRRHQPGLVDLLVSLRGELGVRAGFGILRGRLMVAIPFAAIVLSDGILFCG